MVDSSLKRGKNGVPADLNEAGVGSLAFLYGVLLANKTFTHGDG
jgi:hypothetical protein